MKFRVSGAVLAGASLVVLASTGALAARPSSQTQIDLLQQQIDALNAQVADLKRSTSDEYADVARAQANQPKSDVSVSLKNGRPSFKSTDGAFSLDIRALVQFDTAYYADSHTPVGVDFSSGSNFRRARLGVQGVLFSDWSYQFIYDFGGSGSEGSTVSSAYIQYDGLGPVHWKIGAYATPESFDDTTSASDLLFLERAQPTDLARSIAGSDGRDGTTVFAYDDSYFAAISYTGDLVQDTGVFDEQQAVVARAAYRLFQGVDSNFAIGADSTYLFKAADTAAGPGSPKALRLRERPELNVDDNNIRLIDTGTIDASRLWEWGVEAAGNWHNFYGQGGYFGFDVTRRASALPDPSFEGWYAQASWVLTGESKPYVASTGSYGLPKPHNAFSFDHTGIGAWELAARYSVLDLNHDAGAAGLPMGADGVRGGEQKIWTVGLNWYPNAAVRLMLDYQHTDVSRLDPLGADIGAKLDVVSLRTQFAL
jgi:phosphate-selective porin OprO/OprP